MVVARVLLGFGLVSSAIQGLSAARLKSAYLSVKGKGFDSDGYDMAGFDVSGFNSDGIGKNGGAIDDSNVQSDVNSDLLELTQTNAVIVDSAVLTPKDLSVQEVSIVENASNDESTNIQNKNIDERNRDETWETPKRAQVQEYGKHKNSDHSTSEFKKNKKKTRRVTSSSNMVATVTFNYYPYTTFAPGMTEGMTALPVIYPTVTYSHTHTVTRTYDLGATVTLRYPCGPAEGCQSDYTICDEDIPLCAASKCSNGYYNSAQYPLSECIPLEHGIMGTNNVALSCDGLNIIQGVPQNASWSNPALISLPDVPVAIEFRGQATAWYFKDGVWTQVQILRTKTGRISDWYGNSVDTCAGGERVVVGAFLDSFRHRRGGTAYVFDWDESVGYYRQVQQLIPTDLEPYDYFGAAVKISADCNTIVVGAYGRDGEAIMEGAVYIYKLGLLPPTPLYDPLVAPAKNLLTYEIFYEVEKLFPPKPIEYQFFGQAIAINWNGTEIFIGGRNTYAVYDYRYSDYIMTWKLVQTLPTPDGSTRFGQSVATNANATLLAVGAPEYNDGEGRVYFYRLDSNSVYVLDDFAGAGGFASPPDLSDTKYSMVDSAFGFSVAMSCDQNAIVSENTIYQQTLVAPNKTSVLIGAINATYDGGRVGVAFLYRRSPQIGFGYTGLMFNTTIPVSNRTDADIDMHGFGAVVTLDNPGTRTAIADFNANIDIFSWATFSTNSTYWRRRR